MSESMVTTTIAHLASVNSTTLTANAMLKTNHQYIAEQSLNNAVTFLATVATMHYIIGVECPKEIHESMLEGAKMLIDLVEEANGGVPVCPIKSQYVTSTDDTVEYVYEGKGKKWKPSQVFLALKSSNDQNGTHLHCKTMDSDPQMKGQWMKETFMMIAAGQHVPIFITITGLTQEELCPDKYPTDMLIIPIEGLSIAGAVNPTDKMLSYICFITKSNGKGISIDQIHHNWYQNNISSILERTT